MEIKVHMLAFADGEIREVTIPDDEMLSQDETASRMTILDQVFYFGQNDFAIGPEKNTTPSVSAGDVIEWTNGRFYVVAMHGFTEITAEQFTEYKALDRRERQFHAFVTGRNHESS